MNHFKMPYIDARVYKGDSEPGGAIAREGDLWIDTSNNLIKEYSGSAWVAGTASVADNAVTNAKVAAAAAIAWTKMAALAQGSILVGNASNAAAAVDAKGDGKILVGNGTTITSVAVSGDATLTNAGAVAVTDLTISGETNGDVLYFNGTNWIRLPATSLPAGVATGLAQSSTIEAGANDVTLSTTTQTVGDVTLTIPDFANVDDTFVFNTLAATLTNKTLTSPTVGTSLILKNTTRNITLLWAEPAGSARNITFADPGANVNVLYDKPGAAQEVSNKTFFDSTCKFGDEADVTKDLFFSLGGATADKTMTIISSQTDDRSLTLPDATDTLVGKATADVFTNKSFDCDGAGNVLTNVNANELDPVALTSGTYGIPFVIPVVNAGAATNVIYNSNAPLKFRVIDVTSVATKACNGNWKIDNGTNDITANVAYGADKAVSRAAVIDDAYHTIAANGSLRLISSDATDTAILYIHCMRCD